MIAHVRKKDDGSWDIPHSLEEHLKGTAFLAEKFASKFGSGTWGRAVGFAHDAGKGRKVWQQYLCGKSGYYDEEAHLEGKPGKIPHAIYGAKLVEEIYGKGFGRLLAYCIAGHHTGLPDWSSAEGAGQASLQYQLDQINHIDDIVPFVLEGIRFSKPDLPPWPFKRDSLDLSLWVRMLYSSLVDADFLDTEAYMDAIQANNRGGYASISELFERYQLFNQKLDEAAADTPVNQIRRNIREKCIQASSWPQGVFSLSVPTGGGKTLSSLGFALAHAKNHKLDRVIYVIPYTSIIEQNAEVFRSVLGEDQVVEHHSSIDERNATLRACLASENWDAPVIVTTSVQFFESLFAAKPGRCRKLHNIANSVVILDEAQLIPIDFLRPILEVMQLLVEHYHVSFVLSTATQPALGERIVDGKLFKGLRDIREIIGSKSEVKQLYDSLKRVKVQLPGDFQTVSSWEEIAEELKQYHQVLCIVSRRDDCLTLHQMMPKGTFHLSALMCGQHRSEIIARIKEQLSKGESVRVISTQLVEAGVDFDFPVVYRAIAGLDSIAQAAGRCNREGRLPEPGKVVVFYPPSRPPVGHLRKAAETACSILATDRPDPLDYDLFEEYFAELYWKANSLDVQGIIPLLEPTDECGMYFRTAAERFRIIKNSGQKTILVPYGEGGELIELLKTRGPERWLMRKLQRYTVNIYNHQFNELVRQGVIEEVYPYIYALSSYRHYSNDTGLLVNETMEDPEYFII